MAECSYAYRVSPSSDWPGGNFNSDHRPDLVINVYPGNGAVTTVETMLHQ
jgi:hypothetical protein